MSSKRKAAVLKGEKVPCPDLRQHLYGLELYRQASMLRKGREVHKIYVDVHKGLSFMDDRFSLTEFGRMVLESGSVRAGRARNVRQIVVARETLYCSGTTGCMRACGGQGQCLPDCDKAKVRGHKCSFRVKLTMRLGFVDHWFVEILGSHNAFKDTGDSPVAASSSGTAAGAGGEGMPEPTDYHCLSGDSSSSATSDDVQNRNSPMPDVAALLRQNGASAAAAAALCEQYRSSPPVLYLSTASPLNIPVFPEPFSISAQHRHRQAMAAAAATAVSVLHSQPQLSSLDLSCKAEPGCKAEEPQSSPTKSRGGLPRPPPPRAEGGQSQDSPIALTSKASSTPLLDSVPPAKNGHVTGDKSWSEKNELLKSYLSRVSTVAKNGGKPNGDCAAAAAAASGQSGQSLQDPLLEASRKAPAPIGNGDSVVASDEAKISKEVAKKYWTYQFSTPELSPSPSPQNGHDKTMDIDDNDDDDDDEGSNLVIDDERNSGEEDETREETVCDDEEEEEEDDKVAPPDVVGDGTLLA